MNGPHDDLITSLYADLPRQLQSAARWLLDHPQEVALFSMREQARMAGVTPATMTRLSQALGFDGFERLRADYAAALRAASGGLAQQAAPRIAAGCAGSETIATMAAHVAALSTGAAGQELATALRETADAFVRARRVFCLGHRASHAVALHLHYILSLVSDRVVLLDAPGATGFDALHDAGAADLLIVVGVRPYSRAVVVATDRARQRGTAVVALTDSRVSPLCQPGDALPLVVPTSSPGFLHMMSPAFLVAEALAAAIAAELGDKAVERLHALDRHFSEFETFVPHDTRKRRPAAP